MLAWWEQKRPISMLETHMFEWHARITRLKCRDILCSNRWIRWAESKSRVRHVRSYIWMKYIKMVRLQYKQCIKTNSTKVKSISFVLKYNQANYTMIVIELSRNLSQCKALRVQISKIYQTIRSSKFDRSKRRSVWSRQHQTFDWTQQAHTFE